MSKSKQANITNKLNGSGINRIIKATHCSFKGFKVAWQCESAFRQELIFVMILLPFAFIVSSSFAHQLILISSLLFVLFAEIINSALEALADAITLEHNTLIGRAKDMGSAGVFIALSLLVLIWGHAICQYLFSP
jgi:diacylglycerol kinase (ATP)